MKHNMHLHKMYVTRISVRGIVVSLKLNSKQVAFTFLPCICSLGCVAVHTFDGQTSKLLLACHQKFNGVVILPSC